MVISIYPNRTVTIPANFTSLCLPTSSQSLANTTLVWFLLPVNVPILSNVRISGSSAKFPAIFLYATAVASFALHNSYWHDNTVHTEDDDCTRHNSAKLSSRIHGLVMFVLSLSL